MKRRSFFAAGLAAASSPLFSGESFAQENSRRVYEMLIFKMKNGDQGQRMDEWCQASFLLMAEEYNVGPIGIFKAAIADYTPHLMIIVEHPNIADIRKRWAPLIADQRWGTGLEKMEKEDIPAYENYENRLMEATPFSPPLSDAVGVSDKPRLFEYRVYHAPTFRQLRALSDRFEGPEIKLFHKSGINPILYAHTVYGPDMPNLAYLMPFQSLEAREKAWAKFRSDPEWKRVSAESKNNDGEIVSYLSRNIYTATDYSQIK